jgi:hypothetical protein
MDEMTQKAAKVIFGSLCPGIRYTDADKAMYGAAAQAAFDAVFRVEIERLQKQCEGLANAAMNNGQSLMIYERALTQIKELSDSEDGDPLDDAIRIAERALKYQAPELSFAPR